MLILAQDIIVTPATTEWWNGAVGGALIAGVFVAIGWIFVHFSTQSRDRENWRRATVTDTVTAILENSQRRFDSIRDHNDDEKEWIKQIRTLESKYIVLTLCVPDSKVTQAADNLLEPHRISFQTFTRRVDKPDKGYVEETQEYDNIYMPFIDLGQLQKTLRNETMYYLKSQKRPKKSTSHRT